MNPESWSEWYEEVNPLFGHYDWRVKGNEVEVRYDDVAAIIAPDTDASFDLDTLVAAGLAHCLSRTSHKKWTYRILGVTYNL